MENNQTTKRQTNREFCFGLPFLLETKSIEDASKLANELGLAFVELNTNFPASILDRLKEANLNEMAATYGIFYTLHLDDALNFVDINPLTRQAYVQTVLEAIELCKATGITVINAHFAKGNIVTLPDGKHYINEEYPDEFQRNLLAFREQCEKAIGDTTLRICIENTDAWADYERRAIECLLESPVFALTLDIGHDHATKNRDLAFIQKHQDRLCHMHAHDGVDLVNHLALGSGEIPLHERFNMAKSAKATVVLETKTIEALRQSVEWLESAGFLDRRDGYHEA